MSILHDHIKEGEEEFDEKFPLIGCDDRDFEGAIEKTEIKSFLATRQTELYEKVRGIIYDCLGGKGNEHKSGTKGRELYDSILDDLLSTLDNDL